MKNPLKLLVCLVLVGAAVAALDEDTCRRALELIEVEYEDIHIPAGGHDMVESSETDVVGPTIAANGPHGLFHKIVGH